MKKHLTVSLTFLLLFGSAHITSIFAMDTPHTTKIDPILLNAIEANPTAEYPVIIFFTESPNVALMESYGVEIEYVYNIVPGLACKSTGNAIKQLALEQNVVRIEVDSMVNALAKQMVLEVEREEEKVEEEKTHGTSPK